MIRNININDLHSVVKLHKDFLPSIIAFYSEKFIKKFYHHHLIEKKNTTIFLGYYQEEKLIGFVFGTYNVSKLFDDFIKENKFFFFNETLLALFNNPKFILHLIEKVFPVKVKSNCQTQLVYIVVDKSEHTKGVGKSLLQNFESKISKKVDYYELEVEENNTAKNFYLKNDFFMSEKINNIFEKKYLMGKNLK